MTWLHKTISRLILLAFAAGLLWVLWIIFSAPDLDDLEREWIAVSGFDPLAEIPPRVANEDARDIEKLAASFGLAIAPAGLSDRVYPTDEAVHEFSAIRPLIRDYFAALGSTEGADPEPESVIEDFLDRHHDALQRIAEKARSTQPSWDLDYRPGGAFEYPRLFDHHNLHDLLLLEAIVIRSSCDRRASPLNGAVPCPAELEAVPWIEAARALRRSLSGDRMLISFLIFAAELRHEASVLRHFENLPEAFRTEYESLLRSRILPEEAVINFRLETWMVLQMVRAGHLPELGEESRFIIWPMEILARHGIRHQHEAGEEVLRLIHSKPLYQYDHESVLEQGLATIPTWSLFARLVTPDFGDIFIRTGRVELDLELTLKAHRARAQLLSEPCSALERIEPSVVEGIEWAFTCGSEGLRLEPSDTLDQMENGRLQRGLTLAF